jgi:predicted SnoaL-like aldol condensation-catalyzing enzyme
MNIVKLVSIFLLIGLAACNDDNRQPIKERSLSCLSVTCEANNKLVIEQIYDDIINGLNSGLVESLYAENFIQHNTNINTGISGQTAYFNKLNEENPNHIATIKHIVADGDYVAVHWHFSTTPEDEFTGTANVDLYKLSDKKIVEQWDFSMASTSNTASGNSVFSDLYDYGSNQPNNDVLVEEENKTLITDFYINAFNNQDLTLVDEQVDENYIQHNPFVPDGRDGLSGFIESGFAPKNVTILVSLAKGDIVWTFRTDANVVDLWRIDNNKVSNKIVEHWDIF